MPGRPPPERQCTATSKQSGERCERWTTPGYSVCPSHGSKTPRGIAHHNFQHGRFSASIPARLSKSYEEALNDPTRLELNDELAIIIARNRELLRGLQAAGGSARSWRRLRTLKGAIERARRDGDVAAVDGHLDELFSVIERGATDAERWSELMTNFDQQRKLAESERKRRIEDRQVVTTEEIMALMGALLAIITRHVKDERVRHAIGTDIEGLLNGPADPCSNELN